MVDREDENKVNKSGFPYGRVGVGFGGDEVEVNGGVDIDVVGVEAETRGRSERGWL